MSLNKEVRVDIYIEMTGGIQRAMKRDKAKPSCSRGFSRRFVDVHVGTGHVFFRPTDDAVSGISLTKYDLRRLMEEIEDRQGAVVIERMSRVLPKKRGKRSRRRAPFTVPPGAESL